MGLMKGSGCTCKTDSHELWATRAAQPTEPKERGGAGEQGEGKDSGQREHSSCRRVRRRSR